MNSSRQCVTLQQDYGEMKKIVCGFSLT